jgi:hypothetical protein
MDQISAPTKTCVSITPDIFLHTIKYHHPIRIQYEIENNLPMELFFELKFNESQNILLYDRDCNQIMDSLDLKCNISPFTKQLLGEIHVDDPTYRTILKTKYNWKKTSFSSEKINELALSDKRKREVHHMTTVLNSLLEIG